jgi:hypothetical protein
MAEYMDIYFSTFIDSAIFIHRGFESTLSAQEQMLDIGFWKEIAQ